MTTPRRPKLGIPFTDAELDAVVAALPPVPFTRHTLRHVVAAHGLTAGRGGVLWATGDAVLSALLRRGQITVVSREPRHSTFGVTGVLQPDPLPPADVRVRVSLVRPAWPTIARELAVPDSELDPGRIHAQLRPLVDETIAAYSERSRTRRR